MGESEWKHAGWVSGLGKWAWIVGLVNGLLGLLFSILEIVAFIAVWAISGFGGTPGA